MGNTRRKTGASELLCGKETNILASMHGLKHWICFGAFLAHFWLIVLIVHPSNLSIKHTDFNNVLQSKKTKRAVVVF